MNLLIMAFDKGYTQLFGYDNQFVLKDGKTVHLSLDERAGCFLV
jgi:xyloglucan:xyloglucosyl transferase